MRGLKGRLLEKSIEAYILSLETVNRLSIKYRIETFCYLICNAWELMLKAKLLHDAQNKRSSILYPKKRGEQQRSLAMRACIKKIFTDEKNPTRRNIELIEDLRDKSTHLVISKVPKEALCLFQANILNYHRYLQEWFQISISDRVSVGMMTICYDFDPEEFDPSSDRLKRELGLEAAKYLMEYQAELRKSFDELKGTREFSISIDYHLGLVKHLRDADIELTKGKSGTPTQIVEVAKDPSKSHPYRQSDVLKIFNESQINSQGEINQYDIQCVVRVLGIKSRPEFYYRGDITGSPSQYSQAFIDFIIQRYQKDTHFFEQMRKGYLEQSAVQPATSDAAGAITDKVSFVPL